MLEQGHFSRMQVLPATMVDSTKIVCQRNFWRTKFTPKNLSSTKFSKILRQIFPYEKFVGVKIGVNLRKEMSLAAVS